MSSKRRERRANCQGKIRHADEGAAQRHVDSLRVHDIRRGEVTHNMNYFYCRFCGGYHVGHRPGANPTNPRNRKEG